jgi:hypothetical protein
MQSPSSAKTVDLPPKTGTESELEAAMNKVEAR